LTWFHEDPPENGVNPIVVQASGSRKRKRGDGAVGAWRPARSATRSGGNSILAGLEAWQAKIIAASSAGSQIHALKQHLVGSQILCKS
jgi:hypothetical protein